MRPFRLTVAILLTVLTAGCDGGIPSPNSHPGTPTPPANYDAYVGTWSGTWIDGARNGTMTLVIARNGDYDFFDSGTISNSLDTETGTYNFSAGLVGDADLNGNAINILPVVQTTLNNTAMTDLFNINWSGNLDIASNGHLVNSTATSFTNVTESGAPVTVDLIKQSDSIHMPL